MNPQIQAAKTVEFKAAWVEADESPRGKVIVCAGEAIPPDGERYPAISIRIVNRDEEKWDIALGQHDA
jgi:hypothetical protein